MFKAFFNIFIDIFLFIGHPHTANHDDNEPLDKDHIRMKNKLKEDFQSIAHKSKHASSDAFENNKVVLKNMKQ